MDQDGNAVRQSAGEGEIAQPGQWPVLRNPHLQLLLRHWAEMRRGLMAPRSAIDPAILKACLPDVWLFRYDAAADAFLCTLAGERVNEAWGTSLIGKRPQHFMPPASAAIAQGIYRRILLTPAVHVSNRRIAPSGQAEKGAERLVVPLSDDAGRPYGIFGLSIYHFDPLTQADKPPYVGPEVTYYPCAGLPDGLP